MWSETKSNSKNRDVKAEFWTTDYFDPSTWASNQYLRWTSIDKFSKEELREALQIVTSAISRCEKAQPKFAEGSSPHSLLKNRIKALAIAQSLITEKSVTEKYTIEELTEALRPVASIISKCTKAQQKFAEGSTYYTRLQKMIHAMEISQSLIMDEIGKRTIANK